MPIPEYDTGAPNTYKPKESNMTDAAKRAFRTFVQAFVGTLAMLAIPAMTDIIRAASSTEPYEFDVNFWQGVMVAAVLSGAIALISWAQNALEEKSDTTVLPK